MNSFSFFCEILRSFIDVTDGVRCPILRIFVFQIFCQMKNKTT